MKTKLLNGAPNIILFVICASLVIVYLGRPGLPLPEKAETIQSAQRQPAPLPASDVGLIGPAAPPTAAEIEPFVKTLHIHGIPYEQARQFGPEAIPILLDLLADPENGLYATNIVVTLGFLGYPSARQPLLDYLSQTQGEVSLEQFRALTAVPFALSQLAYQGDISALNFLLQGSNPAYWNGVTLPWTYNGAASTAELYQATLLGLGVSGLPQAQTRLEEIANGGRLSTQAENEALQQALALNRQVQDEGMALVVSPDPNNLVAPKELQDTLNAQAPDTNPNTHLQTFTIARHISLPANAPGDAQIDDLLFEASRIMQTTDSASDIGCCVGFQRNGAVSTFSVSDGIITTNSELNAVFGFTSRQVKVVAALDFCGGFNPSIVGCAFLNSPKNMILEYLGNTSLDGILWAHEFGHNQGLQHPNPSVSTRIMNGSLFTFSTQVNQAECNAWHNTSPNPGQVIGPCPFLFTVSQSLAATSVITSGTILNYTILIENDTFNAITDLTVSDTLPANTSYVPGSATASPPIIDLTNFPASTPAFTLNSNASVQINYAVQVGAVNSHDLLINTAFVDASSLSQPIQARDIAIVDALKTYLPIIFK
jgi:uncharacterized repeat protein (TIGR01451 family)